MGGDVRLAVEKQEIRPVEFAARLRSLAARPTSARHPGQWRLRRGRQTFPSHPGAALAMRGPSDRRCRESRPRSGSLKVKRIVKKQGPDSASDLRVTPIRLRPRIARARNHSAGGAAPEQSETPPGCVPLLSLHFEPSRHFVLGPGNIMGTLEELRLQLRRKLPPIRRRRAPRRRAPRRGRAPPCAAPASVHLSVGSNPFGDIRTVDFYIQWDQAIGRICLATRSPNSAEAPLSEPLPPDRNNARAAPHQTRTHATAATQPRVVRSQY